jgi:hypothetical protein
VIQRWHVHNLQSSQKNFCIPSNFNTALSEIVWLAYDWQLLNSTIKIRMLYPNYGHKELKKFTEWESNTMIYMQKSSAKFLEHCCKYYILPSLNLSQDTRCSEIFHSFPQSFQANASTVPTSGHDYFQINFSSSFINHPTSWHYNILCWHHHNKTIFAMYNNITMWHVSVINVQWKCHSVYSVCWATCHYHIHPHTNTFHRLISLLQRQQYVE